MPDDERDEEEPSWLLQPPDSGEVHVHIAIGSDVELSPETTEALETFMSSLQESEVSGFDFLLGDGVEVSGTCKKYGKCQPVVRRPCRSFVNCRIAPVVG